MIKPEFWTDERTGRLSDSAKITFIAMLNIADDEGKLNGDESYLFSLIYPYGNSSKIRFRKSLEELKKSCLIIPYSVRNFKYILIPNFNKHQRIDKPQESKIPDPDWDSKPIREYFFYYQNGVCPVCNREMVLVSRGDNVPDPYSPDENNLSEEYVNGYNSRVLSIDHIHPKSKGGSHKLLNLRAICITCNKKKKDNIPGTFQEHSENVLENDFPKISKDKEKEKEKEKEKIYIRDNVSLYPHEIDKLYNDYGKEFTERCFDKLDNYKGAKGRKYKSDYRAILMWVVDAVKKENNNGENRKQFRKGDIDVDKYRRELDTEK